MGGRSGVHTSEEESKESSTESEKAEEGLLEWKERRQAIEELGMEEIAF